MENWGLAPAGRAAYAMALTIILTPSIKGQVQPGIQDACSGPGSTKTEYTYTQLATLRGDGKNVKVATPSPWTSKKKRGYACVEEPPQSCSIRVHRERNGLDIQIALPYRQIIVYKLDYIQGSMPGNVVGKNLELRDTQQLFKVKIHHHRKPDCPVTSMGREYGHDIGNNTGKIALQRKQKKIFTNCWMGLRRPLIDDDGCA